MLQFVGRSYDELILPVIRAYGVPAVIRLEGSVRITLGKYRGKLLHYAVILITEPMTEPEIQQILVPAYLIISGLYRHFIRRGVRS